MYFFNKTNDILFWFDIYLNNDFILNDYNNITKKNISDLRELIKKIILKFLHMWEKQFEGMK